MQFLTHRRQLVLPCFFFVKLRFDSISRMSMASLETAVFFYGRKEGKEGGRKK